MIWITVYRWAGREDGRTWSHNGGRLLRITSEYLFCLPHGIFNLFYMYPFFLLFCWLMLRLRFPVYFIFIASMICVCDFVFSQNKTKTNSRPVYRAVSSWSFESQSIDGLGAGSMVCAADSRQISKSFIR